MKFHSIFITLFLAALISFASCNNNNDQKAEQSTTTTPSYKEDNITYAGDNVTMNGYVVYDENKEGSRPAILVVHEWWGLNDYSKRRAKQLAELGYIAMAVDLFGNGRQADNPDSANKLATPFYNDPQMTKRRFDAALAQLKTYAQADTGKIAAIGYCFGGTMVLNLAKLGENLAGVVSFHGILPGIPANKDLLKAKVLVCHGGSDPFVPKEQSDQFKHQMDSIGADYSFKVYEGATHAFTNPGATAIGKKFNIPIAYSPMADSTSWQDMKEFFGKIF
jgi:dienelactone hydrolase